MGWAETPAPTGLLNGWRHLRAREPWAGGHPAAAVLLCAAISLAVLLPGFWVPSFWTDEAATASAVGRSWPELAAMLGRVDVVHGAYYVLTKLIVDTAGLSEVTLRLPSVLAGAGTAVLTLLIGRRLAGPLVGFLGALILLFLPRFEFAATDARSYSLAFLCSTAAVYTVLRIRAGGGWKAGVALAVLATATVGLSFYGVSLVAVLLAVLAYDRRLRRRWKILFVALLPSVITAGLLASAASRQSFQVAWIPRVDGWTVLDVLLFQWFGDAVAWPRDSSGRTVIWQEAVSTSVLLAVAAVAVALAFAWGGRRVPRFLALWALLPTALIVGASAVLGTGLYLPRYLGFTLPAIALLMAGGLVALCRRSDAGRRTTAVLLFLTVAAGVLSLTSQRSEFDRYRSDDFRFIADVIAQNAQPGDAFAVRQSDDLFLPAYPRPFSAMTDLTLVLPASRWELIFNLRARLRERLTEVARQTVVWSIHPTAQPDQDRVLESQGFVEDGRWTGPAHTVIKFVRR